MFDTLKTNEEFDHFMLENCDKIKVEEIGSIRVKLHNSIIPTFYKVTYVPFGAMLLI